MRIGFLNNQEHESLMKNKKRFLKIIVKHLETVHASEDDVLFQGSEEDENFPVYVMDLMKEINDLMPKDLMEEIKSCENIAAGHIDYGDKFALYCAELYVDNK